MADAGVAVVFFAGALLASGVLTACNVSVARWLNWQALVREDAPSRHQRKQGTPSLGGLSVLVVVLGAGLLAVRMNGVEGWQVLAILWLTVVFGVLGFVDDYLKSRRQSTLGFKARYRLAAEILVALSFAWFIAGGTAAGHGTMLGFGGLPAAARIILGALVVVASANAVNLTDGLDGLAAGLVSICALGLGVICWVNGAGHLAVLCAVVGGAAAGFLWFNAHPAQIFMGDVGSLGLGALLGGIAVAGAVELIFAVIAAVFVIEALTVIIQVLSFRWTGRRVFAMTPIHHAFELRGWAEPQIVVRFWLVGLLAAAVGVLAAVGFR